MLSGIPLALAFFWTFKIAGHLIRCTTYLFSEKAIRENVIFNDTTVVVPVLTTVGEQRFHWQF